MFALILLFIAFGFIILAFIYTIASLLTSKESQEKDSKERKIPKFSQYAYGFALLSLIVLIFASLAY